MSTALSFHHRIRFQIPFAGESSECVACNSPLTVKHTMLDCVDVDLVRTDHFNVDSMKEVFEKVQADSILAYLKEIF